MARSEPDVVLTAREAERLQHVDPFRGEALLLWGAEQRLLSWAAALQRFYDYWEVNCAGPKDELGWFRVPPEALERCLANDRRVFELLTGVEEKENALFTLKQRFRQAGQPTWANVESLLTEAERVLVASRSGPSNWTEHCVAISTGLVALAFHDSMGATENVRRAHAVLEELEPHESARVLRDLVARTP